MEAGMTELEALRGQLRDFSAARDWEQFHSPKNLAMALAGEAGELLEIFQWLTEEQSRALDANQQHAAREEIADILLYLVRLADRLGIDPAAEARRKMLDNERKYPADKARGNAKKYTEL
jgi:NTP pyrophosphatase (non-canonical NTP hydrolase)